MDGVEAMTRGWWRPTAGSIYPLLRDMSEQGILKKRDGGKYELTSKARTHVEGSFASPARRPQTMDDMVSQMHNFVSYMEDVKSSERKELHPHIGKIRGLAKRLTELAGGDEKDREEQS